MSKRNLVPLNIPNRLAKAPTQKPKYVVPIRSLDGQTRDCADPRVTRALVALMNLHAVNGGAACHWGGPAALAEMMSALHAHMFAAGPDWYETYHFVNDAGHTENGVYALRSHYGYDGLSFKDLWQFRALESKLTGHGESHVNPEGVLLSNGPLGSSVAQAQGLCLADRAAGRERLTFLVISDGASMEGEAREVFASLPGLAARGLANPFVMLLSDNNTKLSGRVDADAFSMKPSFEALQVMGWKVKKVENGHDLEAVYQAIEWSIQEAKREPHQPVCLWFKTIKGYGVKATEESASGGHGFPLKAYDPKITDFLNEIFNGETPSEFEEMAQAALSHKPAPTDNSSSVKKEKAQAGFARAAIAAAKEGLPVFSISADLQGSTGIAPFHKEFPDNFIEVGVAESNMVSVGAGFAKAGFIPIVDTFAQFGVTKGNLPLTMAALSQAPVLAIFSHIGFQDAADGASHQATTYLTATACLPQTVCIVVACSSEAEAYMQQAIQRLAQAKERGEAGESVLFFVGRENFPAQLLASPDYSWGKAQVLRQGSEATVVACGATVFKALEAADELEKRGRPITVINHPFANRPDVECLKQCLEQTQSRLITIEDHQVVGGMGSLIGHQLALQGVDFKLKSLGIKGHFGRSAYQANHLYERFGLGAKDILEAVLEITP